MTCPFVTRRALNGATSKEVDVSIAHSSGVEWVHIVGDARLAREILQDPLTCRRPCILHSKRWPRVFLFWSLWQIPRNGMSDRCAKG